MPDAVVVIPARNEASTIAVTIRAALAIPGVTRAVVVDDGSTDSTADKARSAGAEVVSLAHNAGKGDALEAGLRAAGDPDAVLLLDADLGETAAQASALLTPVLEGAADLAIAIFPPASGKAGLGLVKGLARWGIRRLGGGYEAKAPLSGQRALSRRALAAARPFGGGFGVEVTTTVRARRAGLDVLEVPTTMAHSASGRDLAGFAHRGRQFLDTTRALVALAREAARR